MATKCLRQFHHMIGHQELVIEQAFKAVDNVLSEMYGALHFSIFYNHQRLGYLTSLYSSRDGIYGEGERLICINRDWFDVVMIKGQIFSTFHKLDIYDTFAKGFDFLAFGAEYLFSFPIRYQHHVIGVVNLTLPRHLASKLETTKIANIVAAMKPYVLDAEKNFKRVMPGAKIDLTSF